MSSELIIIAGLVVLALVFDFLNGFHDSANSIATIVSTRTLKPHWAVIWAAFFNFIAFLFFKLHVANTVGTGLIDPSIVDKQLIFATLCGAIFWNILTWYYGIPSSSSHALIGALVGASIVKAGFHSIEVVGISKVVVSIFFSPMLGFILGLLLMYAVTWAFFHFTRAKVDRWFQRVQFLSSALMSLGHGGNDAQKTMGIIAILLFSSHKLGSTFYVPLWVIFTCNFVMALGTLLGGWRIVKTMGMRITKLKPVHGCCAEFAGAITLFAATHLGIPVSTTHTIAGAIFGVGSSNSASAVRWGIAQRMVLAWIITLPAAAIFSGLLWFITHKITGV
ncbi:MAG: inorganic phosphate transporter [Proteobacteria bacterium]|nr:inorganic phosphate transporter [Pseudomonadota bacterium]